jgi:hypothetical protein
LFAQLVILAPSRCIDDVHGAGIEYNLFDRCFLRSNGCPLPRLRVIGIVERQIRIEAVQQESLDRLGI